jgi:hypothetical protein
MDVRYFDGAAFNRETATIDGIEDRILDDIRNALKARHLVVVRGAFPRALMDAARRDIVQFFANRELERNDGEVTPGAPNFYRTYDNPAKSKVKSVCKSAFMFYWNRTKTLEQDMFVSVSRFRNRLAGYDLEFTIGTVDDNWSTIPTVSHYPAGGGHLNRHVDPVSRNYCNIIAAMTEKGGDFQTGGLYLMDGEQKLIADDYLKAGDIYLFYPDIPHGIDSIDRDRPDGVNWWGDDGRWALIPALTYLPGYGDYKTDGLKDLEAVG